MLGYTFYFLGGGGAFAANKQHKNSKIFIIFYVLGLGEASLFLYKKKLGKIP